MRKGLSLKWVISGSLLLVIAMVLEHELSMVSLISPAVFIPALIIIALLAWWVVRPLGRLTQWSASLESASAPADQRPHFIFREFNLLADSLNHSMQQVKAASLREERLLRYASHELRTSLAVLKANVELLAVQAGGELPPPLQRIERSVLNMQRIAETLLWMSRESPEALPEEAFDMRQLLNELIQEHRYLIGKRKIELILHISDEPCRLPLTACRIVVGNFLRNALQYSDDGSFQITFDQLQMRIVNRIRAPQKHQESADFGYGLGLALMRQLCAKLGWHIEVVPEKNRFTVILKLSAQAPQQLPDATDT
ncbi:sensor histidine kinase [Pseudomonas frederiksbergensis]|uniref:sensor histidine kinase n=1 Tax=Pseudomonas frederiksbergensis TaxID=104087 RepID=UPI003CFF8AFE